MKYASIIALVLLAGCSPADTARQAFETFTQGCKASSVAYEVRHAEGARVFVAQCERRSE